MRGRTLGRSQARPPGEVRGAVLRGEPREGHGGEEVARRGRLGQARAAVGLQAQVEQCPCTRAEVQSGIRDLADGRKIGQGVRQGRAEHAQRSTPGLEAAMVGEHAARRGAPRRRRRNGIFHNETTFQRCRCRIMMQHRAIAGSGSDPGGILCGVGAHLARRAGGRYPLWMECRVP